MQEKCLFETIFLFEFWSQQFSIKGHKVIPKHILKEIEL